MRLALVACAIVLAFLTVAFSMAQVLVKHDPALAYRLAPYDGRMTAAFATSLTGINATPKDRARADSLAKRALQQDSIAASAWATLGVNAEIQGNKTMARGYFAQAQKLSRRELRTQLFMIENAVQREDIAGALHQYDMTLRVFPHIGDILYPVLSSAISDPVIRRELVKTLARRPSWADNFLIFAAGDGFDPKSTSSLLTDLQRVKVAAPEIAQASVVNKLIAEGLLDAAWSYYSSFRSGADRLRARDPDFSANLEVPSQFDWTPINDGSGVTASIHGGIFDFAAPPGLGGPILQQLQLLPPGTYELSGHSIGIEQEASALPYWTLSCRGGVQLGRVEVPNSSTANGNFSGTLTVPAGCPVQSLVLTVRSTDAVSGLSGQFDRVALVPTR